LQGAIISVKGEEKKWSKQSRDKQQINVSSPKDSTLMYLLSHQPKFCGGGQLRKLTLAVQ